MKLLLVSNGLEGFGGGERWMLEIAHMLQDTYDITIVNPRAKGDQARLPLKELIKRFKLSKVKILDINSIGLNAQIKMGKFRMMLPKPHGLYKLDSAIRQADVVYQMSTNPVILAYCIYASKLYGKRFILGLHNPVLLREEDVVNKKSSSFQKVLLKTVKEIHAQTNTQVRMLKATHYKGNVYYIPHFLYFIPRASKPKSQNSAFNVLFVGRFDVYQKGLDLMADIIEKTIQIDPSIIFNLVGSGSDDGIRIVKGIADRHPKQVKWHKFLTDEKLKSEYEKADLFLMPSRYETPGLALLEAQGYGIPAVAFNVQGPNDIMTSPAQGDLVTPYDVKAFAKGIISYKGEKAKNPKSYERRRTEIRKLISRTYSRGNFVKGFTKMLGS